MHTWVKPSIGQKLLEIRANFNLATYDLNKKKGYQQLKSNLAIDHIDYRGTIPNLFLFRPQNRKNNKSNRHSLLVQKTPQRAPLLCKSKILKRSCTFHWSTQICLWCSRETNCTALIRLYDLLVCHRQLLFVSRCLPVMLQYSKLTTLKKWQ